MIVQQFIQWIQDHLADAEAAVLELDELVHDAKADEAAEINNGGIESQLCYLLGKDSAAVLPSTIDEYCQLLEVPLPPGRAAETTLPEDGWTQDDQQAAYREGWGLFETGTIYAIDALDDPAGVAEESGLVPFRGQRFDGPDRDTQAEEYVRRRAAEGHALAQKALAALQSDQPLTIEEDS